MMENEYRSQLNGAVVRVVQTRHPSTSPLAGLPALLIYVGADADQAPILDIEKLRETLDASDDPKLAHVLAAAEVMYAKDTADDWRAWGKLYLDACDACDFYPFSQ